MNISLKKAFDSNIFLKIISIIIGYVLWSSMTNSFQSTLNLNIPVSFYNKPDNIIIEAPEFIEMELKGKKNLIKNIDKNNLAIHINVQELKEGIQLYNITNNNIFIPSEIIVNNYKPYNFTINKKIL